MKYTQVLFLCAPYLHKYPQSSDNLIESLILVSNSSSVFSFQRFGIAFFFVPVLYFLYFYDGTFTISTFALQ